ncbi:MAG: acyl-CoA dehydrogenase family protein [Oligoflexia bacterium]|nr:acyl-CoA dehydrogenase family protein [Oligoflexia bacterium]
MIRLKLSTQIESLREELKQWLKDNPPPRRAQADSTTATFVEVGRGWQAKLAGGRWVGVHWPREFGGRSLSLVEEAVVQEELVRVNAPQLLGLFGLTMVGPVLIKHGTRPQQERYLSKILSAEEVWCQGFSEPGAGSDLAAIKTKARVTAEGLHITGQKVWTSFAQVAQFCFLLCRTSDQPKKHQGLSYLLIDMKSPGIKVRPLRQITGDDEFNEVFFDEVFVPKENVVGQLGDGWNIAISTLMYERVVLTFARQIQSEVLLRRLLEREGEIVDRSLRAELAGHLAEACAVRALAYQHLIEYASGKSPGPEGSLDKLFWSESFQRLCKFALKLRGRLAALSEHSSEAGEDVFRYFYSRGRTIAAGTSEIQRNIIAERLLSLPRQR